MNFQINEGGLYITLQWQATAAEYWALGCSKDKIIVGIPTYGRGFQLADANNNGWGAPATGPCPAGQWTREAGFYSYYEVSIQWFDYLFLFN
jgi:chitinase